MDEGERGGYSETVDQIDHFHRNEAISAVTDEGFLGEEDDDYEDLYNDVNVGENFLQTMRKNEDLGFRSEVVEEKVVEPVVPPPVQPQPSSSQVAVPSPLPSESSSQRVPIPGIGGDGGESGGVGNRGGGGGDGVADGKVSGFQSQGFRGNEGMVSGGSVQMNVRSGGIRVELGQGLSKASSDVEKQQRGDVTRGASQGSGQPSHGGGVTNVGTVGGFSNDSMVRQSGSGSMNGVGGNGVVNPVVGSSVPSGGASTAVGANTGGGGGNGTTLFVGELHWWTTDAELESELCKYGPVKEVKFFDEKASGKSKGYCQVEFYDPAAASACKEGMNGHAFNGRPCVVAFASPYSVKRMGEAQVSRNQQMAHSGLSQTRRGPGDAASKAGGSNMAAGGNFQGGDNNRVFGRGNWRGNAQAMGGRGPGGPMRGRGAGMGGRGIMGNGGNGFGQGMGGTPPLMHPQSMMGQGFDPAFGGPMGRMGAYGGFPGAPTPPFSNMMPSFPPVGGVGLPGVAPHVNPAFFGRGMPMNAMGMMPSGGVDGPNMGMWSDPNMGGWGGEDHGGGRAGESSYGEEAASDHQYGEVSHDRGGWSAKEKDRSFERDWSGSSERRYRDDRDPGYDREMPREKDTGHDNERYERRHRDDRDTSRERSRDRDRDRERSRDRVRERERSYEREREPDKERERYREDRDRYADHYRQRDRDAEYEDDYDRGRSSRHKDDHRLKGRDTDYGKRRRLTSE